MLTALGGWLLGLVLGMRHALEPDHLAAVSTLTVEDSRGASAGLVLGAAWGVGHSLSLLLVGGTLAALRLHMPAAVADGLECAVAVMIIALGARALRQAVREGARGPATAHHHGARRHAHPGASEHVHLGRWALARRPLLVGLMHGLAGSGALTALVISEMPTVPARLLYIGTFGLGSVAGMAALTGLAGASLRRLVQHGAARVGLLVVAGGVSIAIGAFWGWTSAGRLLGG